MQALKDRLSSPNQNSESFIEHSPPNRKRSSMIYKNMENCPPSSKFQIILPWEQKTKSFIMNDFLMASIDDRLTKEELLQIQNELLQSEFIQPDNKNRAAVILIILFLVIIMGGTLMMVLDYDRKCQNTRIMMTCGFIAACVVCLLLVVFLLSWIVKQKKNI